MPNRRTLQQMVLGFVHIGLRLLALRQWRGSSPWARLDLFSGGCLALDFLHHVLLVALRRALTPSAASKFFVAWPMGRLDGHRFMRVMSIVAYADYGHWRLVPGLIWAPLQAAGLVLGAAAFAWLVYVDRFLRLHFGAAFERHEVLRDGPYRRVRHPRYLGLFARRIGCALALGSVFAYVTAVIWTVLMRTRIAREESQLHAGFVGAYSAYADDTPRVLPRLSSRR